MKTLNLTRNRLGAVVCGSHQEKQHKDGLTRDRQPKTGGLIYFGCQGGVPAAEDGG